jgi:RNA polymerase sigma-70 factor (ECF subfamily)
MPFRVWLRKTALERLLSLREKHLQAGRRALGRDVPIPGRSSIVLAQQLLSSQLSPSEQLLRGERIRAVRRAIAELSESDRDILLMRNVEGLSYEEVAYSLDIQPAAARKRYGRALIRLQRILLDSGFEDSGR